jgi:hypothetical protein
MSNNKSAFLLTKFFNTAGEKTIGIVDNLGAAVIFFCKAFVAKANQRIIALHRCEIPEVKV